MVAILEFMVRLFELVVGNFLPIALKFFLYEKKKRTRLKDFSTHRSNFKEYGKNY